MNSKFDTVDSIVNYLQEPLVFTNKVTLPIGSQMAKNGVPKSKRQQKENNLANFMNTKPSDIPLSHQPQLQGDVQILPKGRVRYGPITVNPRKNPSKTLFTGRRSKNEILDADEEEKRRDRRDRNRTAATKCREKRENVLVRLENEHHCEVERNQHLAKQVQELEERKQTLQSILTNHSNYCGLINNASPTSPSSLMIFGDTEFLSSIIETPALPLPSNQQDFLYNDDEELSHIIRDPDCILTNSAYTTDDSNPNFYPQQQEQAIIMNSGSLERILNSLRSPTSYMDNNNNNNQPILCNSAHGASCAKQYSSSSEEDSLPSVRPNQYVF